MLSLYQPDFTEAAGLAALGKRAFEQAFAARNTPENMAAYTSVAFTTEQFEKELRDENSVFYVARLNNHPVGYAKLRKNSFPDAAENSIPENAKTLPQTTAPSPIAEPCIELQRIYVLQEAMGTGVGKQLMEQCLQTARQQGYRTIWLGVWQHNTQAIAFYRKWGFEIFSSHVFPLGDDPQLDWLMQRSL